MCTQMASEVYYRVQVVKHDLQMVRLRVVCHRVWPINVGGTWVDVVMVARPVLQ